MRAILSSPVNFYYNLNKVHAKSFENLEGPKIETHSLEAREISESFNFEPNQIAISLDLIEFILI